ncbi:MAG: hypothetical protein AMXMBFR82_17610 [Candidatus Hydrogenedentota bacterium]
MSSPFFVLVTFLILPGCGSPAAVEHLTSREFSFLTRDGVRLVGTSYAPSQAGSPGLILVHGDDETRASFESFARKAQREGYHVLAFDRRGYGESTNMVAGSVDMNGAGALLDLEAARLALLQNGADPDNLAVIGAESGANLALKYAGPQSGIQAAVLLTPERSLDGIAVEELLQAFGARPVLLMVSTDDVHGLATAESLRALAPGHCEVREYQGSAEGTEILEAVSTSSGQLLLWLSGIIGPEAIERNRSLDESAAGSVQTD